MSCLIFQDGYTALTLAAKDGHVDIVYQLLQKGAYVNLPDRVRNILNFYILLMWRKKLSGIRL